MANAVAKGHAIASLVLGALEITFGLIIIICSFVLGGKINIPATLTPYWAGIPYIIPGILGIVVGVTKNYCAMVAFMVLNIICFVIDGIATILIAIAVSIYAGAATAVSDSCIGYGKRCTCYVDGIRRTYRGLGDGCDTLKSVAALLWVIIIFAILAAIVTLAGSILGCVVVCCSRQQQSPGAIVLQPGYQVVQPADESQLAYPEKA